MDKAISMGKASAIGSFHLFIGKIFSTLMLGIGFIIVGMFIDQVDYGLYTIALIPATTFLLFQNWGVGPAVTKYCANYRASNKEGELRNIILSGLTFQVITGLFLTVLSLLTANFFATTIFDNPESGFLINLASITIISSSIYVGSNTIFEGFDRMDLSTVVMIISATIQGLLSPLLVYLGFGAVGVIIGLTVGSFGSAITSVVLLYFVIFKKLPLLSIKKAKIFQALKPLLIYGIPLSISSIIGGILPQIVNFVMASVTDIVMIGNFGISNNFAIFLTFFSLPIVAVLFPAFSKLDPSKEKQLLKTVFASSVKYSSLFMVPATMALMVLSTPLVTALFGNKWVYAPFFLTLNVTGNLFVLLGSVSFSRLLAATGETKFLMKLNLLTLCIGIPIAFLLIPPFGIIGVIMISPISGLPGMFIGLYWTWKHYDVQADFQNSARIFLASVISSAATYLFLNVFNASAWLILTVGAILFLAIYVISILLIGAINQLDIDNLRVMFSGLGKIFKLLEILFTLLEKILKVKEKNSKIHK